MSGKNASEMEKEIKNDTELLSEIMSPSMFFFYTLFQVQRNKDINTAISIILICVLTLIMISLGEYVKSTLKAINRMFVIKIIF